MNGSRITWIALGVASAGLILLRPQTAFIPPLLYDLLLWGVGVLAGIFVALDVIMEE